MARALQVPKARPSAGKPAVKAVRPAAKAVRPAAKAVRPAAKAVRPAAKAVKPAVRKVTPRTSTDRQRAKASPLARAVNQKNAPKATRIFIYTTVTLALLTITLMMVVVVFQTRLAETQLNIDAIEQQISVERVRYDELRLQRSSLREPSRLVAEATVLGMVPGTKTTFKSVDPLAVASVLVSLGGLDLEQFSNTLDPLKNYSAVKALVGGGS